MSILTTDLVYYAAASMPQDDVSTSGGAIDTAVTFNLTQWAANNIAQVLSDGADTRTVTVTGRNTAGAIVTDAIVLNGVTPVNGVVTFERVLKIVTTALAARTVTIKEAAGGTIRATIPPTPNTTVRLMFYDAASAAGITIRYEKGFVLNNHGSLTLTNAQLTLTADPAARIRIAGEASVNGTQSVANRLTLPGSLVFVDDSVAQNMPSSALAAASKEGFFVELNLPASDPAAKSSYTVQASGTTT